MKRSNSWQDAYATGTAILDLGDGITVPLPIDGILPGEPGPPGAGVPAGGAALQVVRKNSAGTTTEWASPDKAMVGLSNVDNTADADKPVSTPQATALSGKVGKGELFLHAKDYGAMGNGVADDTAALQAWLNAGGERLVGGTYRITSGLTITGSNRRFVTENATILADAVDITALTASGDNIAITANINGNNKANYGVKTTGTNPIVRGCVIENIHSATTTARGIECTTTGGAVITGNVINNVQAVGDTTLGNANGSARAIIITATAAATKKTVIADNIIDGVTGEEGDGIQVLFATGVGSIYPDAKVTVANNRISNVSRRFIKIQGSVCRVEDNILTHDGAVPAYPGNAIDVIQSENVTVRGNGIGPNPLAVQINVVGVSGFPVKNMIVRDNTIRQDDAKNFVTIYVNYVTESVFKNNTIYGGSNAISMGNSTNSVIKGNEHFGGIAASASFSANASNTNIRMRNNDNLNAARTTVASNAGTGALSSDNY